MTHTENCFDFYIHTTAPCALSLSHSSSFLLSSKLIKKKHWTNGFDQNINMVSRTVRYDYVVSSTKYMLQNAPNIFLVIFSCWFVVSIIEIWINVLLWFLSFLFIISFLSAHFDDLVSCLHVSMSIMLFNGPDSSNPTNIPSVYININESNQRCW